MPSSSVVLCPKPELELWSERFLVLVPSLRSAHRIYANNTLWDKKTPILCSSVKLIWKMTNFNETLCYVKLWSRIILHQNHRFSPNLAFVKGLAIPITKCYNRWLNAQYDFSIVKPLVIFIKVMYSMGRHQRRG